MKNHTICLLILLTAAFSLNAQTDKPPTGPYLGQQPPELQSKVFAPGFISTEAGELNSVFCCDRSEFYFSRRGIPGRPSALMVTKRIDDMWSEPEQLWFSGTYSDIDLFVTPDGQTMVFCSRRPIKDLEYEKADHDFLVSKRQGDDWSEPELFAAEAMSEFEEFYPVLTANGNLYFNSQRGGQGENNIYCAEYREGRYALARKLPEPVNSAYREFDAFVTQDEKMIIFPSTRPGGLGGADIYISFRNEDDTWTEPNNLGPQVNSAGYEYGASISPDGEYFFYTSNRNGSEDIFWISAEVLDQEPAPVIPPQDARSSPQVFMAYFRNHYDDIHDVVMRYHCDDPFLSGQVTINMTWRNGSLAEAEVAENTTGNAAFGESLIAAMKDWNIPEIREAWSSGLPIRTAIKGSDDPDFENRGILTGKVTDQVYEPVHKAMVLLQGQGSLGDHSDTLYTNREGIFIQTLILPGTWELTCSKPGYGTMDPVKLEISKGHHSRQDIILKPR